MSDDTGQAWSEIIIDHSQFPRRHGLLDGATHTATGENPFCGDRIQLQLAIDPEGRIGDARFQATGCAISTASASLLATHVVGKEVEEAEALFLSVRELLVGTGRDAPADLGELAALQLVRQYPARVKCATLAWHVLHHALERDPEVATTE